MNGENRPIPQAVDRAAVPPPPDRNGTHPDAEPGKRRRAEFNRQGMAELQQRIHRLTGDEPFFRRILESIERRRASRAARAERDILRVGKRPRRAQRSPHFFVRYRC